jgi:hypothetical protein
MALTNCSNADTVTPTNLKGIEMSQMIGNKNIATIANGQHSMNSMHHNRKVVNALISNTTHIVK